MVRVLIVKTGSDFLAWRQTGNNDRNITNMSKFSRYEHIHISHRLIVLLNDHTTAAIVQYMPMDQMFLFSQKQFHGRLSPFELISSQLIDKTIRDNLEDKSSKEAEKVKSS